MVGHKKVVLTVLLVTILGITFVPIQSVAITTINKERNYRGTLTISAQTFDFLLGFSKGHIRFAMWDGNSWIELPFWIVHRPEYQTHVDMNNTALSNTGHVVHSEQLSSNDYFVVVIPNEKGFKTNTNNWWLLARKSGFDRRAQLLIGKDPSSINSSESENTRGLLGTLLFGSGSDKDITSVIYVYFGHRVTLPPPTYTYLEVYYTFDGNQKVIKNSTKINESSAIKKGFRDVKERFPVNYKAISIGNIETDEIQTFKAKSLDITVMQRQISFKFYKFKDTGYKYKEGDYFYLPEKQFIAGGKVYLEVEGIAPLGAYPRYLTVKLVSNKGSFKLIDRDTVQGGYFKYTEEISQYAAYCDSGYSNHLYIKLTTWSDGSLYPGEYWIVNATVYYSYYANRGELYDANAGKLSTYTLDIAQPRYEFVQTGWNIIKFPFSLPPNKIYDPDNPTVEFYLDFVSVSDPWTRVLKVYLITDYETALIYSGTVSSWAGHKQFALSADQVQDYLSSVTEAQIGIVLTTYVGYWKMTGQVNITYRPEVCSDSSNSWNTLYVPYRLRAGNTFIKTNDPRDYMNMLSGGYVYEILYQKTGRNFEVELSTYLLTPYTTSATNINIQTTIKKDALTKASNSFKDVIERQYNQEETIAKNYSELIQLGSLTLKLAAILSPDPTSKILLSLGSLGLQMLTGTSSSGTEKTIDDNPMINTFYSGSTPEYDPSSGKYSVRSNYYVEFTDAHEQLNQLYYVSNVDYYIVGQEIYVEITFSDCFNYTLPT